MLDDLVKESSLNFIMTRLLQMWPEHEKFLKKSFEKRSPELLATSHDLADQIVKIAGEQLDRYLTSYKWTCEMLIDEELFFRREDKYRYSKLADAIENVYAVDNIMTPYVQGLLLTQVLWENHAQTIHFYKKLLGHSKGLRHLEVGPGHGLLLFYATLSQPQRVDAWDISEASLTETKKCLQKLSPGIPIHYRKMNVADAKNVETCQETFDTIVLSEILEHTENPQEILENLKATLDKNGKIYINVPSNCPAPDHIYYFSGESDVIALVEKAGLKIEEIQNFPMTGYTLEIAKKRKATISHMVVATHPDSMR